MSMVLLLFKAIGNESISVRSVFEMRFLFFMSLFLPQMCLIANTATLAITLDLENGFLMTRMPMAT